ncbi:DUF1376 domain-containing protein [Algimonas porphyrae]
MTDRRTDMLPVWTDAYLADTTHLELEHHGAYFLLLMKAWRMGSADLPDDDMFLRNTLSITQKKWKALRPHLEPFFTVENGRWKHKRLTAEWEKAQRLSSRKADRNRKNGLPAGQGETPKKTNENNEGQNPYTRAEAGAGAGADLDNSQSNPDSSLSKSVSQSDKPPQSTDRPTDLLFDDFWKAFPHVQPSRKDKAKHEWDGLDDPDRQAVMAALDGMDAPPRNMFAWTWLAQREWLSAKPHESQRYPSNVRPTDPVAAEVYDDMIDAGLIGPWIAWLSPGNVTYEGRVVHPPTPFFDREIRRRYGPMLSAMDISIGPIRPIPANESEKDAA